MITYEEVSAILSYNETTGDLVWKINRGSSARQGQIAGSVSSNKNGKRYIRVMVNYKMYMAHNLIYLLKTGEFSNGILDHIDGCGTNNKWDNLRVATNAENRKNTRKPKNNTSGVVGVYWAKNIGKWEASFGLNNKKNLIGYFSEKEDAIAARRNAEISCNFHPNHGTDRSL
jgi:hypothetical protein